MKKLGYFLVGLAVLVVVGLVANNYRQTQESKRLKTQQTAVGNQEPFSASQSNEANISNSLAIVNISGFDCPSCPAIAESAIKNTQGVLDARITDNGEASSILYNPTITNLESIKKSLPTTYQLKLVRKDATKLNSLN